MPETSRTWALVDSAPVHLASGVTVREAVKPLPADVRDHCWPATGTNAR